MAKATTSKQQKITKKTVTDKKTDKEKKVKGILPIVDEEDADIESTGQKVKGGARLPEDGEKVLDPDLLIGDEPVAVVEPEETDDTETTEDDEDAIIDPEEMNPFGDKWEE